jgi:hypothetical protein
VSSKRRTDRTALPFLKASCQRVAHLKILLASREIRQRVLDCYLLRYPAFGPHFGDSHGTARWRVS